MNVTSRHTSAARKILKSFSALALIFLHSFILYVVSADAQLDPTFGTNGVTITDVAGEDMQIAAFTLPDEKILVVAEGRIESSPTRPDYFLLRYNSDGTPDATYGNNGKIQLPIPFIIQGHGILKAARQPDGKIVLVGYDNDNGIVVRVNENGTLDTSFAGTGVTRPDVNSNRADPPNSVVIQPDGKIIILGNTFDSTTGQSQIFLIRYLPNGSLDFSFGPATGIVVHSARHAYSLHLQSTGKIITSGASTRYGVAFGNLIQRYNANGSADNSFSFIGFYNGYLNVTAIQPDDKILAVEAATTGSSLERYHSDAKISRYNADGTPDTGFGTNGQTSIDITTAFNDGPNALKVLPDGQILVSILTDIPANRGKMRGIMLSLARLSPNGAINGKFLETKFQYTGDVFLLTTTAGRIVTVAGFQSDILLVRAVDVPLQTYKFQAVPFDFLGRDGIADVAIYRPGNRRWFINQNGGHSYVFGLPGDIPVPSDYIGDFTTELAVFRPSTGQWFISRNFSETGFATIQLGETGDVPAPADYDGDSKSDAAVFRPSTGDWHIRNSANNSTTIVHWGLNGDKPAPGDYDGDNLYDIAVFRPSDGNWYILRSSDGGYTILHFGLSGDVPVQEDYDGDGKFDIAVWRPSDGVWYRMNSSDGSFFAFQWGISTDIAVPADYDGDGKADIAVWRAAEGRWYVFRSSTNSMIVYNWGINSDVPLPGKL